MMLLNPYRFVQNTEAGDPYWDKVISLLDFENGLSDKAGMIWTVAGTDAIISNTANKFGGYGLSVSGSLSDINIPSFTEPTEVPFTVEFFVLVRENAPQNGVNYILAQYGSGSWGDSFMAVEDGGVLQLAVWDGNNSRLSSTGSTIVTHQVWHHIALVDDGSKLMGFLDGKQELTIMSRWPNAANPFRIGRQYSNGPYHSGSNCDYDEIRITKGVARYTKNFTPPKFPFPNQ